MSYPPEIEDALHQLSNWDIDAINEELAALTNLAKQAQRLFRTGAHHTCQVALIQIRQQAASIQATINDLTR